MLLCPRSRPFAEVHPSDVSAALLLLISAGVRCLPGSFSVPWLVSFYLERGPCRPHPAGLLRGSALTISVFMGALRPVTFKVSVEAVGSTATTFVAVLLVAFIRRLLVCCLPCLCRLWF